MSYDHINYVRDHSKTRGAARLLLLTIATRTDPNGDAFPSQKCLEADTGMGRRSIRRLLETLPPSELEIIPGGNIKGGKRTATTYRIIVPESVNNAADRAHGAPVPGGERAHSAPVVGVPERAHGAPVASPNGRIDDTERAHGAPPTVLTDKKEKITHTREDAGQAGSFPYLFPVTESQTPHSSAPQKNGRSAPKSKTPRIKASAKVPCAPPSLQEFLVYCAEIEISEQDGKDQYAIWAANEWHDGLNTPIVRWKGKLVTFKTKANLPSDKRAKGNGAAGNHQQPAKKLTAFERWQQNEH